MESLVREIQLPIKNCCLNFGSSRLSFSSQSTTFACASYEKALVLPYLPQNRTIIKLTCNINSAWTTTNEYHVENISPILPFNVFLASNALFQHSIIKWRKVSCNYSSPLSPQTLLQEANQWPKPNAYKMLIQEIPSKKASFLMEQKCSSHSYHFWNLQLHLIHSSFYR